MLQNARGGIKQLRIGPGKDNFKIFILTNNWMEVKDLAKNTELCGQLRQSFDACEWVNPEKVCLFNQTEGWLRISDVSFLKENDSCLKEQFITPIFCPHLMQQRKSAFLLRTLLQHQPWMEQYDATSFKFANLSNLSVKRELETALLTIPNIYVSLLNNAKFGIAERCCLTSILYGDSSETQFWSLVLHYLRSFKRVRKLSSSNLEGLYTLLPLF